MNNKLRRLARALLWFLAVVVVLEIGLRFFGYGAYEIYRADQRLLWVPLPNQHKLTVVNHRPITISDDGFRYNEKLGPKKSGQVRIFTFGDSVTMGWGVDNESHYSAVLERMLNASSRSHNFQVISAGVNAYPNALVLERMKKVFEDNFQPDIVVLGYSFNTGFESLAKLQGAEREKFLRRVRLKTYVRRSAIYNFLIEDVLRYVVYYRVRHMMVHGSWDLNKYRSPEDVAQFTAGLEEAKEICRSSNARLVLLLLGSEGQRDDLDNFQKAMLQFAQTKAVPIVNMIDVLKSKDHGPLFMDHAHPTATGHELIAHELANTIRVMDSLVPRPIVAQR